MEPRDRTLADFAAVDAACARLAELASAPERRRELLQSFTRRVIMLAEAGPAPLAPAADRPPADTETALARSVDILSKVWNAARCAWRISPTCPRRGTTGALEAPNARNSTSSPVLPGRHPAWLAGDLAATLEWLAVPAVAMLHPGPERADLGALTDLAPFPAGLFHLVRVTAWFPLLAAGCPPPSSGRTTSPAGCKLLHLGLAADTRLLVFLCREQVEAAFAALFLVV